MLLMGMLMMGRDNSFMRSLDNHTSDNEACYHRSKFHMGSVTWWVPNLQATFAECYIRSGVCDKIIGNMSS